jgi:heavy metal translocating P-type ATPase
MTSTTLPTCDYCGLPVPRPLWGAAVEGDPVRYCCFGCRFAAAVTQARGAEGAATSALARLGLAIFLTLNVMVFTMALWTQEFYGMDGARGAAWVAALAGLFRYLALLFSLPVLLLLGGPLLYNAWQSLRRGELTTDLLLVIGVVASYVYSAISVVREAGPVYFEVGCMVLVLVTLGRWLEATGKLKTGQAIESLHKLLSDTVRVVRDDGEHALALDEVRVGDWLRVLPGERIPCDGKIVKGQASVDEQILTGESKPRPAKAGDHLYSGSLNLDGELIYSATAPPRGGALARLVDLVQAARQSRGRFQRLADRVSTWFLPAVILVALGAFAYHASQYGLQEGILTGLAVILIACPCALGLATPLAIWTSLGQAAGAQVLFRSGDAIERLADIRAVRFDKTGTLTTGTPTVAACTVAWPAEQDEILTLAAQLASRSTHLYALAIQEFTLRRQKVAAVSGSNPLDTGRTSDFAETRTLPGRGVTTLLPGSAIRVYLGSPFWMQEEGLSWSGELSAALATATQAGQPVVCIGWEGAVRGVFGFCEALRPEARAVVHRLRRQGLNVAVLTGDCAASASVIAHEIGAAVLPEMLPEAKVAAIAWARRTFGAVAMVGDGINDAPALAASDVGIAMGCGADVSRDSAAVCLLGNDLSLLPWAIDLARRTVCVIRQNLFWAFFYNTAGIVLACSGRLNPVLAALAMVLSSFFVVTNSLRLSRPPGVRQPSGMISNAGEASAATALAASLMSGQAATSFLAEQAVSWNG